MKLKIAHVSATFPPDKGGIGNAAYKMALESLKGGHDVTVYTPLYRPVDAELAGGLNVIRMKPLFKYGKAGFVPCLYFALKNYDIVHLHYPFFGGAEFVWLLRKLKKTPKLIFNYHMDVVGNGLKAKIFGAYTRFLLPRLAVKSDKIIVSSFDYYRNSYLADLGVDDKVVAISYGVDKNFVPAEKDTTLLRKWDAKKEDKIILFVGGLEYFKGVDVLIKSSRFLKGDYKIIICGKGGLLPYYEKLTHDLGVVDKIRFEGFVSDEKLPVYYNSCDVFVLPSIDRSEAFGIVLVEAMACGKPVISSNLPGVRSVIDDNTNGLLAIPGDAADLADKIQKLLDNERIREDYGKKGREKVLKNYSWTEIGRRLCQTYDDVFDVNGRGLQK